MSNFKTLSILFATLFSISAFAQKAPTLVISTGGMGTDGATLKSMPKENSATDAAAIYKALSVKADRYGKKSVGIKSQGEFIGMTCDQPSCGIHTCTAGCEFMNFALEQAPKNQIEVSLSDVIFAEKLSEKIYNALPLADDSVRMGATVKKAGNLTCTLVTHPNAKPKCKLVDVYKTRVAISEFPEEDQEKLRKIARRLGVTLPQ